MKKEALFYSIILFLALIALSAFLFMQYIAYQRLLLSRQQFTLEKGRAVYDCMAKYYPAMQPDEKGILVALRQGSCEQLFTE